MGSLASIAQKKATQVPPLVAKLRDRLPRINVYQCEYGCHTVTVDVDHGVTPFMIPCQAKSRSDRPIDPQFLGEDGKCIGTAESSFYPKGPKPGWIGEPTHEWYKPDNLDDLEPCDREHVERGGLLLRERTNAAPIMHGEEQA